MGLQYDEHTPLTISDASHVLGMSIFALRKAADEGRVPSRRTGSGHRLFAVPDLLKFKAQREARHAKQAA